MIAKDSLNGRLFRARSVKISFVTEKTAVPAWKTRNFPRNCYGTEAGPSNSFPSITGIIASWGEDWCARVLKRNQNAAKTDGKFRPLLSGSVRIPNQQRVLKIREERAISTRNPRTANNPKLAHAGHNLWLFNSRKSTSPLIHRLWFEPYK